MAKQLYQSFNFRRATLELIDTMNTIVDDYMRQGFVLTVRQLYYQLVSRNVIPNTEKSYKNVTSVVNDARLAGMMDWDGIEDRTRSFIRRSRWTSGAEILKSAANSFHMDMWSNQDARVFVIIEKEALAGVLERICQQYDAPLLAARGYPSGTVLREFAENDLIPAMDNGQDIVVLHLGDHDPSGIDMSRDLEQRITLFAGEQPTHFARIALNMSQIQSLKPPPNPAKSTDARFADYYRKHGQHSWELDALDPTYLINLVKINIENYIDSDRWDKQKERIKETKDRIIELSKDFN